MLKRITCLMAALLLVISSGAPALAVTPQEGWFIRDIETVDGIDYYIIDNKMSDADWWVDLTSTWVNSTIPIYSDSEILSTSNFYGMVTINEGWYGYDQYNWRVDSDWLVRYMCSSKECNFYKLGSGDPVTNVSTDYDDPLFCAVDRSKVPSFSVGMENGFNISASPDALLFKGAGTVAWASQDDISGYQQLAGNLNTRRYLSMDGFTYSSIGNAVQDKVSVSNGQVLYRSTVDVDGTDINDLIFFFAPSHSYPGYYCVINARVSIQLMCPVDKAPSGMAVGDYWPKVRPLDVEIADAFDAYRSTMLDNGMIKEPSDINSMFGQLGGMQEDGLGALELGDGQAEWVTGVYTMLQPLFIYLLPIVGLGVLLIIFANKGMHG